MLTFNNIKTSIRKVFKRLFSYDKWDIGIFHGSVSSFISNPTNIKWLNNLNKYAFVADPMILSNDSNITILAEYYNYFSNKGKIISIVTDKNFSNAITTDELICTHHLSYPNIFEYDGEKYCIPESSQAKNLSLYKLTVDKLTYIKEILNDFPAIDSTMFFYKNKWWLFCGINKGNRFCDIYLFHSDNPLGEWSPHKNNPIISGSKTSRPAGDLFFIEDDLYRPSQNCTASYGGSIILNKVTKLSEDEYEESFAYELKPDQSSKYPDGIHTICVRDNFVIIDGKREEFSILNPIFIILQKLRLKFVN